MRGHVQSQVTRRDLLSGLAGAAGAGLARPFPVHAASLPTAPVAVARCKAYGAELAPVLEKMFDQIGGLGRLVKNKTVAIKINLTDRPHWRLGHLTKEDSFWSHPFFIGAVIHLMARAGARRFRILEGAMDWPGSLEEFLYASGWNQKLVLDAAPKVDFVNTNLPYPGSKPYTRFTVPRGGLLFPAYDLNTAFDECDVFVSLTKMKEHVAAGVTLSMKNTFGNSPCTIYGDDAGVDEPSLVPIRGRNAVLHMGRRPPSKSSPPEKDPASPRQPGYRIPRATADAAAARPIHLAIVEGIRSMAGGEGPWSRIGRPCQPGVIAVGTNCVTTDAVCTAIMGFDPLAERGTAPFERCDSTLRLAEELGLGTRDLKQIEVIGTPIEQVRFDFRAVPSA